MLLWLFKGPSTDIVACATSFCYDINTSACRDRVHGDVDAFYCGCVSDLYCLNSPLSSCVLLSSDPLIIGKDENNYCIYFGDIATFVASAGKRIIPQTAFFSFPHARNYILNLQN